MKRIIMLTVSLFCLCLTGCSAAAYFLSDCGGAEADLVVVNNSPQDIWSIRLDYGDRTHGVQNAREHALLEQGESCGLELETGRVTVTLSGRSGRVLARTELEFSGERLYLTLEANGGLSISDQIDG